VRELRNVLERAMLLCDGELITAACVDRALALGAAPGSAIASTEGARPSQPRAPLHDAEQQALRAALAAHHGSRRELASRLGISPRTLYRKLRELDIGR